MKTVFIGGCARSGTTLLGSILGTHAQCLATPESKFNVEVYFECLRQTQSAEINVVDAFNRIKRHLDFKGWGIDIDESSLGELANCNDYAALMQWLVKQFAAGTGHMMPEIWVDHTPTNIDYAATLFDMFPDARLVHLIRDGRAVATSVMNVDWGPSTVLVAAHWWIEKIALGLVAEASFGAERVLRISYEDLILAPQITVQELCNFLEIEFQPAMVTGAGFHVPKYIAAQHPLIGSALDANRIVAWQNELTPRQVEVFESVAGPFLSTLGYELMYGPVAKPVRGIELFRLGVEEVFRDLIVNQFHRRFRLRHVNHRAKRTKTASVCLT